MRFHRRCSYSASPVFYTFLLLIFFLSPIQMLAIEKHQPPLARTLAEEPPKVLALAVEREGRVAEAAAAETSALAEGSELAADDGTPDGRGLLGDGLTVVVRLTPLDYPARLTAIRIYFVSFQNQPSPVGKTVRLIAFSAPGPKPPATAKYLVDRQVTILSTGAFVDFPIDTLVQIDSGDFFVGYQAPSPAQGVGVSTDTQGPQADRTYWRNPNDSDWNGPLRFTDNVKGNALIRARVAWPTPGAGDYELRTDDGTAEGGFLRDGYIYVNRLTPPRYPARLTKVRIWVQSMTAQPSPEGKTVQLVVFREPSAIGSPPLNPQLESTSSIKLGAPGAWTEFTLPSPVTIESGDVYVGFQSPNPHTGVAFPIDTNGQPYHRMFRSLDGGKTFTGPIVLTTDNTQTAAANLMVRAVVSYGELTPQLHQVETNVDSVNLSEGSSERFSAKVNSTSPGPYQITAVFDPPVEGLSAKVDPPSVPAGQTFQIIVRSEGPSDVTSAHLVVTATDGPRKARVRVPVFTWREISSQQVGVEGGVLQAGPVRVFIPKQNSQSWGQNRRISLLTGKPVTGFEESLDGEVYRLEGLPEAYSGGLEIHLPASAKQRQVASLSHRLSAPQPKEGNAVALLQFATPNSLGKNQTVTHLHPAVIAGESAVVTLPQNRPNYSRQFRFSLLWGWLNLLSAEGNFVVFYPFSHRDAAIWVVEQAEKAFQQFQSPEVRIDVMSRISRVESLNLLGFPVHPIRITIGETENPAGVGETRGGQITLNRRKFETAESRQANRGAIPHEIMHLVQSLFGPQQSLFDLRQDPRLWMDEALAVWYEPLGLNESQFIPGEMNENLAAFLLVGANRVPETEARDYGYGASSFITYLSRFVDTSIPRRWLETRDANREPWATLLPLIGGDSQLPHHWRSFALTLFSRNVLPNPNFPDNNQLRPFEDWLRFELIKDGEQTIKTWGEARDLSFRFYDFVLPTGRQNVRFPELTDVTALSVQLLEKLPDVDIFVFGSKGLLDWKPGTEEILLTDEEVYKKSVPLIVGVANNHYDPAPSSKSRRTLRVKMGLADPKLEIAPPFIGKRVIGATYEFTTKNINIPQDATYTWDFGDGKTATGRNVKTSWSRAGDYKVTVTVQWPAQRLTASVVAVVAPDTPPVAKAEVLFEVFRLIRNRMGQSYQMCNDYAITITNVSGAVVETGTSVARNGAYETWLPVADHYSYTIRYNYTTPCRDSGTVTGKFNIKAGIINSVRVETPRCETN
ncbi:MAG: PKD domain-containing protein [Bryobacteraceae bacterium]|nr:PKD domain-containing protein [Bryobacteraceae bacterium]MDW8378474.1 PKD domain-containing protein [Bryobacterales bacterium]